MLDFVLNRLYRYGLRPFKNGSGRNPHSGKFAHPAQYVQIWAWPINGVPYLGKILTCSRNTWICVNRTL